MSLSRRTFNLIFISYVNAHVGMVVQQNLRILIVSLIMYNDFIDTRIETANSLQMILSSTIDESSLTRHFNPILEVGNFQNALTVYSKSVSNPKRKKQTNKQINKQRICQNSKINCLIKKIPANLHVGFSEFWSKEKAALYNKISCPFRYFLCLDAANSKKVIVPVVATVGPLTLMIVLWFVWRHLRRQNRNNDDGQNLIDEQNTQPI